MKSRVRARRAALALLLLLAAPLALDVAASDHVFSHRLVVTGRVLDAEGIPVAGAAIDVSFEGIAAGGACLGREDGATGPRGDFQLCRHAHEMPEHDVFALVTVRGESFRVEIDKVTRRAAVNLELEAAAPESRDIAGMRLFERTLLVTGRLMLVEDGVVERIPVNGTTLERRVVEVQLRSVDDDLLALANGTTNDQGDYAVDLDFAQMPEGASVRVVNGDETREAPIEERFRRVNVDILIEIPPPPERPTPVPQPGTQDVRVPGAGLGATVLALLALAWVRRF